MTSNGQSLINVMIVVGVLGGIGYVLNIIKMIFEMGSANPGKTGVRMLGVIVPIVGAIAGWF